MLSHLGHRELARGCCVTIIRSRRRFLVEFGGGVASVVLVSACSSDEAGDAPTGTTATGGAADEEPETTSAPAVEETREATLGGLVWQEVSFGFVSAYLLQRGSEVTIVDTGTGTIEEFESGLANLGSGWGNVANVILTHSHGDHIGGLGAVIENAPAAKAFAGSGDLDAIAAGGFDAEQLTGLNDGAEVFGLEVIATPGHTPGHIAVFDAATGVLVAGDAINTSASEVTGPNPAFTTDMASANASVAKLLQGRTITTALVGHGSPLEGTAGESLARLAAEIG